MESTSVYRDRALLKFKRHYFHGLRNGMDSETAASEARWKARADILPLMEKDPVFKTTIDREEAWADALSTMLLFQMLLMNVPIDTTKIGPMSPPVTKDLGLPGGPDAKEDPDDDE